MLSDMLRLGLLLISCLLAGCGEEKNLTYLTDHPLILKQEIINCQTNTAVVDRGQNAYCQTVMTAATKVIAIINEQQENPEKFGQKILEAETQLIKLKNKMHQLERLLSTVKADRGKTDEIISLQSQYELSKIAYRDQYQTVKTLLAIAGLNSPE